jgi:glycosyltransferase involved in cell wall biosynthesis
MERFIYDHSFAVTTIAPGMAEIIRTRTGDREKVRIIPNFVDTRIIVPRPRKNLFSSEYGLDEPFTVVYAGNMGPAQGLETLIEAAELTSGDNGILYVFVGDGTARASLQQTATSKKLSNVQFIPQQSYERVPDIYGASDLCIVPLVAGLLAEAVPSKVYRIMAAERRVLAITDPDSDLASVVKDAGAGIVVAPGNPHALAQAIREAARNRGASAHTGRQYVLLHVDRPTIAAKYSELLTQAARSRFAPAGR